MQGNAIQDLWLQSRKSKKKQANINNTKTLKHADKKNWEYGIFMEYTLKLWIYHNCVLAANVCLSTKIHPSCISVIDMLALQDVKQNVAAVEKMSGALKTLSDLYIVSTFRLPPKLGGVLLGFYNKQDNKKYLELAIMGKINRGTFRHE